MESIINCFGNIVGTTQDSLSDSGLYITDLEQVDNVIGLIQEEGLVEDEVEEKLLKARRVSVLRLHSDITAMMLQYATPITGFTGHIGDKKTVTPLQDVGKSGIRIVCNPLKDAEIVLSGINTIFNETGVTDVHIASNYSDDVETVSVDTVKGKLKTNLFAEPITLPLHVDAESPFVEYYIYHENDLDAYSNKIKCSTCSKFRFDASVPYFKEYGYERFINAAGFNGEIDELGNLGVNSGKGLQLNLEVRCRTDKALCRDKIDFYTNPIAMPMATAIQYRSGSVLIWEVIRSPKLNRVVMGDMEGFKEAASYYERKYNDMVRYIALNMPITSDCYCMKQKARRVRQ